MPLEDLAPDLYDLPGEWSEGADPFEVFRTSRFARVAPFLVEAPFELVVSGATVRGRIDAVYQHPPRHWEVVDFKSGRSSDDPARNVQLEAYALAAKEAGLAPLPPEHLTVTFAYLGAALEERSARVDESWLEAAHHHLKELIGAIAAGRFEPTPSDACHRCDFLRFCPEGRTYTRT
jgi:RecB family exonuclease